MPQRLGRLFRPAIVLVMLAVPAALAAERDPAMEEGESFYGWTVLEHVTPGATGPGAHGRMFLAIVEQGKDSLVAKCDRPGRNSIYVGFYADRFLGAGPHMLRTLQYSIDGGAPIDEDWAYDWSYAHQVDHARAMAFLHRLENAHQVKIDAVSANYDVVSATFDVTGADLAIGRLRQLCRD